MKIKDLMSISGTPGLFKLLATKQSGIVAESLETGQKKFFAARSYQFSPLESIAIYTQDDAVPLEDVFKKMKDQPPADLDKSQLRDYFTEILPDHDPAKVYVSDIKKIISWYTFLDTNGYLEIEEEQDNSEAATDNSEEE
ncbi:MAG TPA: DUF5606 domain-containing protein [Membranihabitans sp.]|nr:DUF5606 domain-containing protein [Membranihabitans sp.]